MTNLTDLTVTSLILDTYTVVEPTVQAMVDTGDITIKNGIVTLTKGSAIAAALPLPTATDDDYKRLTVISKSAQAHTVTSKTDAFGHGGTGEDVGTFAGTAVGESISFIAFQGYWYITGKNGVTVA